MDTDLDTNLLEHVLNVSLRLAETRSLQPLLYDMIDEAIKLVGAERGYAVLRRNDGSLDYRVQRNNAGRDLHDGDDQISHSVLDRVITDGQSIVLRNAITDPEFGQAESVMSLQLHSVMCVPLISRGTTLGAIYVENRTLKDRFSEDDLPPLILFANQTAVAIENATLNDDLETRVAARTQELNQAISQIEQNWADAIEANRLRTTLLTRISHDLRTPLTVIINTLSLMRDGELGVITEDQTLFLDESLTAANHIMTIGNDLFDLTHVKISDDIILNLEPALLQHTLERVYNVGKQLAWPETVTFELDLPDDLPQFPFDSVRIRQVLLNLITYAHERTTSGSVTLYAYPLSTQNTKIIEIGIADTGPTLAQEQCQRLFERFHFTDADIPQLGAGASLPICRELVELHGGHITAETASGGGLNIAFTLPI